MHIINQNELKESSYSKLNQAQVNNVVTKAPNRTVSIDKLEMLLSEITDSSLIENRYSNCVSSFTNWMCFWRSAEDNFFYPSAVYQPTTTSIK